MSFVTPVTLRGAHVALEPLAREHESGLRSAAGVDRRVGALRQLLR